MHNPQRSRNCVLVWSWCLDSHPLSGDAGEALLSVDEKARCHSFVGSLNQRRFVAGRAGLRSLLGEHLGLDPRALVFVQDAFGKPTLSGEPSTQFSLSHSEDGALLAVSDTLSVGADIECVRALDHLDLANQYFRRNEVAEIESLPHRNEQVQAFYRIWTLKEAVVKALGKGLSIPLESFEVSISTSPPALVVSPGGASGAWWLHSMTPMGGYCGALAAPADGDVELIQRTF
jgi:4'-phosphopantetheinyl transferase